MSKNREKKHTEHVKERQAHEQEDQEQKSHSDEHHLVEAPKGTSRTRFVLNFLLVIFLLLVFSITGPFMDALTGGGGGGDDVFASWTLPNGEQRSLSGMEFTQEQRSLDMLRPSRDFSLLPYLLVGDLDPENPEDAAHFLILEDMARLAGISTATSELAETIMLIFGTREQYYGFIDGRRSLTRPGFEKMLRRGLAVRRYKALMASGASEVDPQDVAKEWQSQNQEFDFQYVQVETASFMEEAKVLLLADEELEAWCEALEPQEKAPLMGEESWSAKLGYLVLNDELAAPVLLERFPRPEDEILEDLATKYYGSFSHVRFVRPEEPEEEPGEVENPEETETPPEEDQPQEKFFSYEEVADAARREAPIYYALEAWLNDLNTRLGEGQVVDLETEAISVGLTFEEVNPRTRGAWGEGEEPWAGEFLARSMMGLQEGKVISRVVVEDGAFAVAEVLAKHPATIKPFPEIKEQAAELWLDEKCSELATAKLEGIRDALGERPEEGEFQVTPTLEEFRAAAEGLDLEVVERGFIPRFPRPGDDPEEENPADSYLRANPPLFSLVENEVPAAGVAGDGENAFLVRYAGQREADVSKMLPQDLVATEGRLRQAAEMEFFATTLDDLEWIKRNFNLYLRSWSGPEGEAEGTP